MTQYKVIAGGFHIKGFQPDGDSIRFQATNQANTDEDVCGRYIVFAKVKQAKAGK